MVIIISESQQLFQGKIVFDVDGYPLYTINIEKKTKKGISDEKLRKSDCCHQ